MHAVAVLSPEVPHQDFCALYQREFPFVFQSLRRLGVARPALEDFAHDVFVLVFKRWETYDPARPLRPWLFGIAYRVVLDFNRKLETQRTSRGAELDNNPARGPSPEEQVAMQQAHGHVNAILETMELGRRAVFLLHELEGCTMPVIAETLGVPLSTAYSRLRLARRDFNEGVRMLGVIRS
jgi:RNA polymerase sigma-70 factor, ECF subfamily